MKIEGKGKKKMGVGRYRELQKREESKKEKGRIGKYSAGHLRLGPFQLRWESEAGVSTIRRGVGKKGFSEGVALARGGDANAKPKPCRGKGGRKE